LKKSNQGKEATKKLNKEVNEATKIAVEKLVKKWLEI